MPICSLPQNSRLPQITMVAILIIIAFKYLVEYFKSLVLLTPSSDITVMVRSITFVDWSSLLSYWFTAVLV